MSKGGRQMMLWVTEVSATGDGRAVVSAKHPVLEGGMDKARKALGGTDVVTRDDVYRLLHAGYIKGRKLRPGKVRRDGRASNTKWVFDLVSCAEHKRRMEKMGNAPKEALLPIGGECELL